MLVTMSIMLLVMAIGIRRQTWSAKGSLRLRLVVRMKMSGGMPRQAESD